MKHLRRTLILCALFLFGAVFGAGAEEAVTSQDIYGWTRIDSGYDADEVNGLYDTVNIIGDVDYGVAMECIKQSVRHDNSWKGISQVIPPEKLVSGHNYVLEYKFKMSKSATWIFCGFHHTLDGKKYYSEPYGANGEYLTWKNRSSIIPYTTEKLPSGLKVIFCNVHSPGTFWIAEVVCYDEADPLKTNLLVNGNFSMTEQSIREALNVTSYTSRGGTITFDWQSGNLPVEEIEIFNLQTQTVLKSCNLSDKTALLNIGTGDYNLDFRVKTKIGTISTPVSGFIPAYYNGYIPHWEDNSKNPVGKLNYTADIVSVDGRNSVLKIEKTSPVAADTIASFRQVLNPALLKEGHTYRLEMDLKTEAQTPTWVLIRFGSKYADMFEPYTPNFTNWTHRSMNMTVDDLSKIYYIDLQCQHNKVVYYIDHMTVYDTADELKTNILLNGDFDAEVKNVSLTNITTWEDDEKIHVAWDTPSAYIRRVTLYNAADMTEIPISENSAELSVLYDAELIFEIEDIYGGVRRQSKIIPLTSGNDAEILDISFDQDVITAKAVIRNTQSLSMMAVYRNGKLIHMAYGWREADESGSDIFTFTYQPVESGVYRAKLFIWNSLKGMSTVTPAVYRDFIKE